MEKAPRMEVEPRAVTLVKGGSLAFTCLGVREGDKVTEPVDLLSGSVNLTSEEPGGGNKQISQLRGLPPTFGYQAPKTPGLYHLGVAGGKDHALKTRVAITVVHPPERPMTALEQRSVTVTVGRRVAFSVTGNLSGLLLKVEEPSGGTIEPADPRFPHHLMYKAPTKPGTYHVVLASTTDSTLSDRAEVVAVADDY